MRKGKKHTTSLSQDCERGLDSKEVKKLFFSFSIIKQSINFIQRCVIKITFI